MMPSHLNFKTMLFEDQLKLRRFFHVCTDGASNGIVYSCDRDFRQAVKASAIAAYKNRVQIIAYCHMSTHSHFAISCTDAERARCFINDFKRDYARYVFNTAGVIKIYRRIHSEPIEITDWKYMRNCISYILLNPVSAGIAKSPEEYRWSSFNTYFNDKARPCGGQDVAGLGKRALRKIFHSHSDLKESGFLVDSNNNLIPESFVNYRFVEDLFVNKTVFFRCLALTNSLEEEEKYVGRNIRYSDTELFAEAMDLSEKIFGKNLNNLTHAEKKSLLVPLARKTKVGPKRLARILRLNQAEISSLFGIDP